MEEEEGSPRLAVFQLGVGFEEEVCLLRLLSVNLNLHFDVDLISQCKLAMYELVMGDCATILNWSKCPNRLFRHFRDGPMVPDNVQKF
jgi:hypothetical protein